MGIDDRPYMRERYRERKGLVGMETEWNDKRARREHVNHERGRYRTRKARRSKSSFMHSLLVDVALPAVFAIGGGYAIYRFYLATMIPAFQAMVPVPFPASGTVYLTDQTDLDRRQGMIRFKAPERLATSYVLMLHDVVGNHDVLGVFLGGGKRTATPVPVGTYRVRVAEGNPGAWKGPERLFGTTVGRELMLPLTVTTRTDKTLSLDTPVARNLQIAQNSNRGFVEP